MSKTITHLILILALTGTQFQSAAPIYLAPTSQYPEMSSEAMENEISENNRPENGGKIIAGILLFGIGIVGILCSPLVWLAYQDIKKNSGNIIYWRKAYGLGGKEIRVPKISTMTHHEDHDQRKITPLGHFLRKWDLDKIPLLRLIWKGEINWFGPSLYEERHIFDLYKDLVLADTKPGVYSKKVSNSWSTSSTNPYVMLYHDLRDPSIHQIHYYHVPRNASSKRLNQLKTFLERFLGNHNSEPKSMEEIKTAVYFALLAEGFTHQQIEDKFEQLDQETLRRGCDIGISGLPSLYARAS